MKQSIALVFWVLIFIPTKEIALERQSDHQINQWPESLELFLSDPQHDHLLTPPIMAISYTIEKPIQFVIYSFYAVYKKISASH